MLVVYVLFHFFEISKKYLYKSHVFLKSLTLMHVTVSSDFAKTEQLIYPV